MAYYINTLDGERSVHGRCEPKCFKDGDLFWKICTSLYANFRKKNLIRYVLWKVSNFALIFYVIRTLHKKIGQSLWPSLGRIGWDFFSKIGIEVGTYFVKKAPNFEIVWPAPATPRALTLKGVYEVSYSCYGQINGTVCTYFINCPYLYRVAEANFSLWIKSKMSSNTEDTGMCNTAMER